MSTRSRIGIRNKDNTITSIYCHWDGYPTWNGKMLLTYYTKREDVEKLIKLGNLSTLGRTPAAPDPMMWTSPCSRTSGMCTRRFGKKTMSMEQWAILVASLTPSVRTMPSPKITKQ